MRLTKEQAAQYAKLDTWDRSTAISLLSGYEPAAVTRALAASHGFGVAPNPDAVYFQSHPEDLRPAQDEYRADVAASQNQAALRDSLENGLVARALDAAVHAGKLKLPGSSPREILLWADSKFWQDHNDPVFGSPIETVLPEVWRPIVMGLLLEQKEALLVLEEKEVLSKSDQSAGAKEADEAPRSLYLALGACRELLVGPTGKPFTKNDRLIREIEERFPNIRGLAERTLKGLFAKAAQMLQEARSASSSSAVSATVREADVGRNPKRKPR